MANWVFRSSPFAVGALAAIVAVRAPGETKPIAENITETGRSLNRRVEIVCTSEKPA